MLMTAELKEYFTWFIYFFGLPYVRYNCGKFHHCWICMTDFREGGQKGPPIREARKSPSWIGLRTFSVNVTKSAVSTLKMCQWNRFRRKKGILCNVKDILKIISFSGFCYKLSFPHGILLISIQCFFVFLCLTASMSKVCYQGFSTNLLC